MKLIIIYGPPATGKLTIANELKKLTDYKIFHNHLVGDLVGSILKFNSPAYKKLSLKFRLELLEEAAKSKEKGITMTFVYSPKLGKKFFKDILRIMKKNKVDVYFVKLSCSKKELRKRVLSPSRKKFTKVQSVKDLNNFIGQFNLFEKFPHKNQIEIDNTNKSAKEVAKTINSFLNKNP